jgi:hypothetical protein
VSQHVDEWKSGHTTLPCVAAIMAELAHSRRAEIDPKLTLWWKVSADWSTGLQVATIEREPRGSKQVVITNVDDIRMIAPLIRVRTRGFR